MGPLQNHPGVFHDLFSGELTQGRCLKLPSCQEGRNSYTFAYQQAIRAQLTSLYIMSCLCGLQERILIMDSHAYITILLHCTVLHAVVCQHLTVQHPTPFPISPFPPCFSGHLHAHAVQLAAHGCYARTR